LMRLEFVIEAELRFPFAQGVVGLLKRASKICRSDWACVAYEGRGGS
jgi:hypothetical protein